MRGGETRDEVRRPRPGGRKTHPDPARGAVVGVGSVCARLFVTDQDMFNRRIVKRVVSRHDRAAGVTKDEVDTLELERVQKCRGPVELFRARSRFLKRPLGRSYFSGSLSDRSRLRRAPMLLHKVSFLPLKKTPAGVVGGGTYCFVRYDYETPCQPTTARSTTVRSTTRSSPASSVAGVRLEVMVAPFI